MPVNDDHSYLNRLLLSLIIIGSLAMLAVVGGIGLMKLGRSPEFAIVLGILLIMPTLVLVSGWITWGLRRDD